MLFNSTDCRKHIDHFWFIFKLPEIPKCFSSNFFVSAKHNPTQLGADAQKLNNALSENNSHVYCDDEAGGSAQKYKLYSRRPQQSEMESTNSAQVGIRN